MSTKDVAVTILGSSLFANMRSYPSIQDDVLVEIIFCWIQSPEYSNSTAIMYVLGNLMEFRPQLREWKRLLRYISLVQAQS
jgi:hypothetical protein